VSHPILTKLSLEHARSELAGSKDALEELLDRPVTLFAYPNGKLGDDFAPEHAALAKEIGFVAAFTTHRGAASALSPAHLLPRGTPWAQTPGAFVARLVQSRLRSCVVP
jgi:peptidoglycan/xylan/chitin deacetylase (PgdA/CDA1 family)